MQKEADIRLWGDVFVYLLQDNKNGNVKSFTFPFAFVFAYCIAGAAASGVTSGVVLSEVAAFDAVPSGVATSGVVPSVVSASGVMPSVLSAEEVSSVSVSVVSSVSSAFGST